MQAATERRFKNRGEALNERGRTLVLRVRRLDSERIGWAVHENGRRLLAEVDGSGVRREEACFFLAAQRQPLFRMYSRQASIASS